MVRNVNENVNNDFCFTLSCELVGWPTIAKSQALEIIFRAHNGAIEWVLGEWKSVIWVCAWTKGEVQKRKLTNKMLLHSDLFASLGSSLTPTFLTIRKHVAN